MHIHIPQDMIQAHRISELEVESPLNAIYELPVSKDSRPSGILPRLK
jgi:hypothetical protein